MGRKGRVSSRLKKKRSRKSKERKQGNKALRRFFLIVCEGEKTEPIYFEELKKDLPKGVLDNFQIDIDGIGKNTIGLIEETLRIFDERTKNLGRVYDQVWVVFDRDSFPADHFNQAIFKGKRTNPEIKCAWSNEAFELWYLLHFEFLQSAISRFDYQKKLEEAISRHTGKEFKYRKNDPEIYKLLNDFGDVNRAIQWAKRLTEEFSGENFADHNPCTLVFVLVEELLQLFHGEK